MTRPPSLRVEATQYVICGLPEDDVNASVWCIRVERRAPDQWAVLRGSLCLSNGGKWDYEPIPSERTDAWKKRHRFPLETAIELACREYPKLVINGYRVSDGKLVAA